MSEKVYTLTRELVREVCPECADTMEASHIVALKLTADDIGSLFPGDDATIKLFSGFSQGLCNKFGEKEEGFFTRCSEAMAGKVEDEKGFCASLHKFCVGKWPAEKEHAVADLKSMTRDQVAVKCPECAKKMAAWEQDMPVDNGGHMQHICGKGGRVVGYEEDELHEYSNAIRGVEIFSTGTHNGDKYTEQDLEGMVTAFKELDYAPAIKVGHTKDEPGAPSYGWVRNLRRVGGKLYADFEDLHDSVVEALRKRSYDRVSSEIYFNLKRAGKIFPRALKAVALLGAEVPAVAKLVPLHKMQFTAEGFEAVVVCEQELEVSDDSILDALAERVAGLVTLIKEYDMAKNAAKIAELKANVEDMKKKMDEMMKKKGKMKPDDMEDDEEYAQLSAQAKEIADKVAALEAEDKKESDAQIAQLKQQLADADARDKAHAAETKTLSERLARIEKQERDVRIGERVRACKVPAFRSTLHSLYAYATEHSDASVKVYTEKDGKTETVDKALIEVVDEMVGQINAQSEKLFSAIAAVPQIRRHEISGEEDAGAEVNARVQRYRTEHPEVAKTMKYEEVAKAVLAADPDLLQRYDEQVRRAN